ncbi:Stomatin-like protein 1 [Taenia crassiceps]|uniref:Stomatin-like protein 1 n=1 Tax=Taenia crassiceps TaxID=6207 RepID=A0ABR4Q7B2_9CEST
MVDGKNTNHKSWFTSGLRHIRRHNENADVEVGLIPLSSKMQTTKLDSLSSPLPSLVDFGNAFEFSPGGSFVDFKSKQKNKNVGNSTEGISTSDDEIPAHYQSIFTYESAFHDYPKTLDDLDEEPEVTFGGGVYLFLVLLSVFLLLFTFPITALLCIKRLSKTKRVIIFRLGRQLKPRGPGYVLVLPFVDECHVIDLDEQTLEIKPTSASTADGGQVEIGCRIVYHIIEVESAVTYWARDPRNLVLEKAQPALSTAICRMNWSDIVSGHALSDIACDIRASVNSCCSSYGIQILEVKLSEAISVQEPSTTLDKVHSIDFHKLGRQIASLSPLLICGEGVADSKETSVEFSAMIRQIASLKVSQDSTAAASMSTSGVADTTNPEKVGDVIERALSRGQIFLGNEKVRTALGGTSLQVFVYASDIRHANDNVDAFYMDSDTGKGELGVLDFKKPSATIHISRADLSGTLDGRLDLLEALKRSQIRFAGSLLALSKLRFLLQFQ